MSCREKKVNIAFSSDQPFMEQISSKYILLSVSWNRYLAKFLQTTFNWSSTYSSHPVIFSDLIATGSIVNLLACGPSINSYPNIKKKAKVHFKYFCLKQMNLKRMRLEAWIFLLNISYRGSSIVQSFRTLPSSRRVNAVHFFCSSAPRQRSVELARRHGGPWWRGYHHTCQVHHHHHHHYHHHHHPCQVNPCPASPKYQLLTR